MKLRKMEKTLRDLKFDKVNDQESQCSSHNLLPKVSTTEFKYGVCTICLSDFEKGDNVKQIPRCKHTFHKECLEKWLERRFVCPNCNLEIKQESPKSKRLIAIRS
jgi:hypothetical protein